MTLKDAIREALELCATRNECEDAGALFGLIESIEAALKAAAEEDA